MSKQFRMELKEVKMRTDSGDAILTYEVLVPLEYASLGALHKEARERLMNKVMRDLHKRTVAECRAYVKCEKEREKRFDSGRNKRKNTTRTRGF